MKMHTFFLSGKAIAIVSGAFGACAMLLFVSGVLVGVRVQVGGPAHGTALTTRSALVVPPEVPAATTAAPAEPVAQPSAATPTAATAPVPTVAAPTTEAPAAPASSGAGTAAIGATADAGAVAASASWPFTNSSFAPAQPPLQSAPLETQPAPLPAANEQQLAQPFQQSPAKPVRRAPMGDVSMIAYVAPSDASSIQSADAVSRSQPSPAPASHDDGEYLVQVGIFRVEQHAKELVGRLTNAGYRATITERQEGDRALHVVRVGRFTGIQTAEQAAAKIGNAEQLVASVVAAPR